MNSLDEVEPLFLVAHWWQRGELDIEVDLIELVEGEHLEYLEQVLELEVVALREVEQHRSVLDVRVVDDLFLFVCFVLFCISIERRGEENRQIFCF